MPGVNLDALKVTLEAARIPPEPRPLAPVLPTGAGPWTLRLPPDSRWTIRAQAEGFWIRGRDLAVGDQAGAPVTLSVWPLATLRGSVQVADPYRKPPRQIVLTTLKPRPTRTARDVPIFQLRCPVDAGGAWSCLVPAARYDLGLSAEGFSSIYRWDVEVRPKAPLDLGRLSLAAGGSVAGWLEVPGGAIDAAHCVAEIAPSAARIGANVDSVAKIEQKARATPCRAEGLFQFAGLEPGIYSLAVVQPGYAAARVASVAVFRDAETFLRDSLVLRKPLRLHLAVTPPLDPYGAPWKVRAFRREEGAEVSADSFDATADEAGSIERPGVLAGLYRFDLQSSQGEVVASEAGVPIEGSEEAWHDLHVDWIEVAGLLRVGKKPSAGTLWFGGQQNLLRVPLQATEDGRFAGFLPQKGGRHWWVDIETTRGRARRWVEVAPGAKKKVELEISLPENRLFGRVLDADGRPAPQALVTVESARTDQLPEVVECDKAGLFEALSLPPGKLALRAEGRSPSSFSGTVEVEVDEEAEVGPVELRLKRGRRVKGEVAGPFGAVPGAPILGFSWPVIESADQTRSGVDGGFELTLPETSSGALVVVSPPGLPLTVFAVPTTGAPAPLVIAREAGTLEIILPGEERRDPLALPTHLEQNGLPLPMVALHNRAALGSTQPSLQAGDPDRIALVVPLVAAGSYRLCLSPAGELAPPPAGATCVSGELTDQGTLRLDLAARFKAAS